jgi:DNA-binding NarL/FixJ family response regulator
LIVDDHPMVARYTRNEVLALRPEAEVFVAGSLALAAAIIEETGPPDYLLLDLVLPDCSGLAGLVKFKKLAPKSVIAVVTAETNPAVMRDCFDQGARGYVTKSTGADEFTEALRRLFANGFFYPHQAVEAMRPASTSRLTRRELQVLQALTLGDANKRLAPTLAISESTFKTYLRNIYEKLNVRTRVQAVRRGIELGLIETRGK